MRKLRWSHYALVAVLLAVSPPVVAAKAGGKGRVERTGSGITGAATDMWITSATKLRLMADRDTPALDINVDTNNGVVTLFGVVESEKAKRAAGTNARRVSGVRRVVNELQVVAKPVQEAVKAGDADIQRAVKQAIERRKDLKDAGVTVEVSDGVARLTGTVASEDDRHRAATAARSTRGVRAVLYDDLEVNERSPHASR